MYRDRYTRVPGHVHLYLPAHLYAPVSMRIRSRAEVGQRCTWRGAA